MENEHKTIPLKVKWSKQNFALTVNVGSSGVALKERIQSLTGVPMARQKLLCKKGWKGSLPDDFCFIHTTNTTPISITLIGSADTLSEPKEKTKFVEDLTAEEIQAAQQEEIQMAMANSVGMIPALQKPPQFRKDGKQEMYQYNRLVSGMPQEQIEDWIRSKNSNNDLLGKVAMTLGLELRRAYINDFAVRKDGTLISALDDGHVQLWKHGELQEDLIHAPNTNVYKAIAFENNNPRIAFATSGGGMIKLWDAEGTPCLTLPTPLTGTTPSSLVNLPIDNHTICIATSFQITRQSDPNQFRLPPQDDEGRRRRAMAQAQEAVIQESLDRMAQSVQVWVGSTTANTQRQQQPQQLRSILIQPEQIDAAPITTLAVLPNRNNVKEPFLVCGDTAGGIRLWKLSQQQGAHGQQVVQFHPFAFYQLVPEENVGKRCRILCMKTLSDGRLTISTQTKQGEPFPRFFTTATPISVPYSQSVYILDLVSSSSSSTTMPPTPILENVLHGHPKDAVICLCELPNGDLLTGGGKMDATLQRWKLSSSSSQGGETILQTESHQSFPNVGYVLALTVLPDHRTQPPGTAAHFAVAAARYNVIQILL